MATQTQKLHELRRKRALLSKEFRDTVALEADEVLSAEQEARLSEIEKEMSDIGKSIERAERALELEGQETLPVGTIKGEPLEGEIERPFAEAAAYWPDQKGWKAIRFVIGRLHAKQFGLQSACEMMEKRFGDKEVAKALNTTGTSTGGALIPQAFLPDIIELLRARVVIRRMGPVSLPMPLGNLTIPRLAAGATAGYQGELDDISVSQETFDDIQLNAKKLTAMVPVTNDLIRRAPIGVENIVRTDLVETMARREDIAFLRGDGSGNSPIGLLNQCSAANKLTVAAFSALDNATVLGTVIGVLNAMRLTMEQNMSRMIKPVWIFTPATKYFILGLRDQVGNFVFRDEINAGTLMGFPFDTTQQLPTNLTTGSGNNGSEIYLVDMSDVILAETFNVTVDASDVAAYKDAGGNFVSTYQRDQTLFRVISEHDLALRHQASVIIAVIPAWVPSGYTTYGPGASFFVQPLTNDMSAAPSVWGAAAPTGSNNPGNSAAVVPGGTLPGRV